MQVFSQGEVVRERSKKRDLTILMCHRPVY